MEQAAALHPNDPRNDPPSSLIEQAHERVISTLRDGESFHKVSARDVFADLIEKKHHEAVELLERLFQLDGLTGEQFKDEVEQLVGRVRSVVDDFVESSSWMVGAAMDEIEQEQREEAMEEGEPYYGEAA